jgi:hypothetical protein
VKRKTSHRITPHGTRVQCPDCDKYFFKAHDAQHTCETCRTAAPKENG